MHYVSETISICAFMARMLFFLPDKHRKMLRYYRIYAYNKKKKSAGYGRVKRSELYSSGFTLIAAGK